MHKTPGVVCKDCEDRKIKEEPRTRAARAGQSTKGKERRGRKHATEKEGEESTGGARAEGSADNSTGGSGVGGGCFTTGAGAGRADSADVGDGRVEAVGSERDCG